MSHDQKPTKMRVVSGAAPQGRRIGDAAGAGDAGPLAAPAPLVPAPDTATRSTKALGLLFFLIFMAGSALGGVAFAMLRLR